MRVFGAGHERVAILERLSDALTSSIRALLTRSLAKQRDATAGLRDQPKPRGASVSLSSPPRWGTSTSIGPARTRTARGGGAGRPRSAARLDAAAHRAPPRPTLISAQTRLGDDTARPLKAEGPLLRASGIRRSGGYFMAGGRLSERRSHPLVAFAI